MIDTIKFKIHVKNDIYKKMASSGHAKIGLDLDNHITEYEFHHNSINVGSYSHNLSILCSDDKQVYIEFSVPKVLNGHNVSLVTLDEFYKTIEIVYKDLQAKYGQSFPSYKNAWDILKLDLCYVWHFDTQDQAQVMVDYLNLQNYIQFNKHSYKTSVMFVGSAYTLKYYLKLPEYLRHDYKVLCDQHNSELANRALELAKGVLRFEVSLRSKQIKFIFGDNLTLTRLKDYNLMDILRSYHNKFIKMDTTTTGVLDAIRILVDKFGQEKGRTLYQFWRLYYSEDPVDRQILIKNYSKSQRYKNLALLKSSKIGMLAGQDIKEVDLSIP